MTLNSEKVGSSVTNEEDMARLPPNLRKLFLSQLSLVKSCALQVKANLMLREEECGQIRDQASY